MAKKLEVEILEHGYQRNGISGEGFYYFRIQFSDDDNKTREAIATLTVESDMDGEYPERFNGSCRIVTPDNLEDYWRGDNFESEIRRQHEMWFAY